MLICSHGLSGKCAQCFNEGMAREAELVTKGHKPKSLKPKKCKEATCRKTFIPRVSMQVVCGPLCGALHAKASRLKKERKDTRVRLQELETLPQLKKRAQIAFNTYCRTRDRIAGHPCISSGRPLDWSGNATDCGHFRSVGSAPHLRYNEDNAHAQSKHDNHYKGGNAVDYRIGLISRIGLARVEALEANNEPRHYSREELIELTAHYRKLTRELLK